MLPQSLRKRMMSCLTAAVIFLLPGFACALAVPEQIEKVDTEALLENEYSQCISWDPEGRPLGGEDGRNENSGIKTTDLVFVNEEGFSLDTGLLRLELETRPMPFRWMYYTQDLETQYERDQDWGVKMAQMLCGSGIHLWMINLPSYRVMIEFVENDLLKLCDYFTSTDLLNETGVEIACSSVRAAGWKDVEPVTLGGHCFLVVKDAMENRGLLLYEAVLENRPCLLRVHTAPDVPMEQADRELAESVINQFIIAVSGNEKESSNP